MFIQRSATVPGPSSQPSISRSYAPATRTSSLPPTLSNSIPGPFIVAQDTTIQRKIRDKKIPFGVQFEIARLLNESESMRASLRELDFTQLADMIRNTSTPNKKGIDKLHSLIQGDPRLPRLPSLGNDIQTALSTPWGAFDLEEHVLAIDPHAGCIGHQLLETLPVPVGDLKDAGEDLSHKYYYGGKVDFVAHLSKRPNGSYSISLRKVRLGQSNKLKRRFGSASLLKCKLSEDLRKAGEEVVDFFRRPLVLWDWVYRAITVKEDSIILFRTNETLCDDGTLKANVDNSNRFSFKMLIEWGGVSKWASRMTLALSTSVPGPLLQPEDIEFVEDIVSGDGSDMTDGCGYANISFFKAIRGRFSLSEVPCAVQVRIFGSKGMLVCNSEAPDVGLSKIWLRQSQRKIYYSPQNAKDLSHRTVDILRITRIKSPARLSTEVIINLSHNGVTDDTFAEILKTNLRASLKPLMEWGEGEPTDMMRLWHVVDEVDNVSFKRQVRDYTTELRFRGLENDSRPKEGELDEEEQGYSWCPDPSSGCPTSISETIVEMLSSGFNPQGCAFLRTKIFDLLKSLIRRKCSKHNWEIEQSAISFAVPDPYGVLGPNEIFFKSSRREFVGANGLITDTVEGDVLITRNPCKLPTDVRKVKAVSHPRLYNLVNCIVFPVQGKRRLIDFLAGGDYDGDRVVVIWDSTLVDHFQNAPEHYATEPPEVGECFAVGTQTNSEFRLRLEAMEEESTYISSMQRELLNGLMDPFVIGLYSVRHEKMTYMHGLGDMRTVREAYMFCTVLDATKSGKKLLDSVRRDEIDRNPMQEIVLPWKVKLERMSSSPSSQRSLSSQFQSQSQSQIRNNGNNQRRNVRPFIMNVLTKVAEEQYGEWMTRATNFFDGEGPSSSPFIKGADGDLKTPWVTFDEAVKTRKNKDLEDDRDAIKFQVEDLHTKFLNRQVSSKCPAVEQRSSQVCSKEFTAYPAPCQLKTFMDEVTIARLRASYAYYYCINRTTQPFPWRMGFRELCLIKANASRAGFVPVVMEFADNYRLVKSTR
ncbi:hypothetical protein L218DRAFT_1009050 [Marasmius fiardii PR-910]|nr:hypothetical protein L218DRAFT_1009050 [Marasmius fiardii PR-910]